VNSRIVVAGAEVGALVVAMRLGGGRVEGG